MSETTSYEQARDELVVTVQKLEAGGIPLEESIALWERGEELARICQQWLDGARARLDKVMAESRRGADRRLSRRLSSALSDSANVVRSSSDAVPVTIGGLVWLGEHERGLVVLGELLPLDAVDRHRFAGLVGPGGLLDEGRGLRVALLQPDVLAASSEPVSKPEVPASTRVPDLSVGTGRSPAVRHRIGASTSKGACSRASASWPE